jgi:hypothetical protein
MSEMDLPYFVGTVEKHRGVWSGYGDLLPQPDGTQAIYPHEQFNH